MIAYQKFYERAVLHGMLVYNDIRPVGYLKPINFSFETGEVENSKIFAVLSRVSDYGDMVRELRKIGVHGRYIYSALMEDKGYISDILGINTPKYCLLILENIFEELVLNCLKRLSEVDSLYSQIVQNIYAEIQLSKMDCFEMAENILCYFRKINFEIGVLNFEEIVLSIDERVKQINQYYEVNMLTSRLKRYCEDTNKQHYIGVLDKIKSELA